MNDTTTLLRRAIMLGVLGAASISSAAAAQSTSTMSASDTTFLSSTAEGSVYEQALSQVGLERGSTSTVRQYAQALVLDHATFNVNLMSLANAEGVVVPVTMNAGDEKRLMTLVRTPATAFDAAFLAEEARINRSDISDESKAIAATQNADIKKFATTLLEGDRFHLRLTQQLVANSG